MRSPPPPGEDSCLFLDVDGTLVDLAPQPRAVRVDAELKDLLGQVAMRLDGAVALVSGRSIAELDALFAPLRLPVAGLHGLERRNAAGVLVQEAPARDPRLDEARNALWQFVSANPGLLLEDKGRTLAVHYRRAPDLAPEVEYAMSAVAASLGSGFHLQEGALVMEVKPVSRNKATAIDEFLAEPPFAGRRPVFIGDDITDRDGFLAVAQHQGLAIAVGDRVAATCQLRNPAAVHHWLRKLTDPEAGRSAFREPSWEPS